MKVEQFIFIPRLNLHDISPYMAKKFEKKGVKFLKNTPSSMTGKIDIQGCLGLIKRR